MSHAIHLTKTEIMIGLEGVRKSPQDKGLVCSDAVSVPKAEPKAMPGHEVAV
jgi:hypothetical protein